MPGLTLGLGLGVQAAQAAAAAESAPPPGTLDFSHAENSALLILIEDD
ncbi:MULTISPECIES: hypothetical protein [unclassified Mesorhizobium]|nr:MULTISPECIES: hypothetical protein [unclassified Mesorhizobium]